LIEAPPTASSRLPRNVLALSAVSFFTDVSSEMIYALLPTFLSTPAAQGGLGLKAAAIGGIEGAAETTASLLKLASGWWSDKLARRKPMVLAGYALATAVRPLVAIATSAGHVLAVRLTDRVGKGVRTSPRDALVADSVEPSQRGRAFGFQRAADNAGAALGPLIASALLYAFGVPVRTVFWIAAVPGVLAVLTLIAFVREVPRVLAEKKSAATHGPLGAPFWKYLVVLLLFTLGNSTDAFLLLRAGRLGVPTWQLPLLWALLNAVKSASNAPAGALSDRLGRRPLIVAGWMCYAAVYVGFGFATDAWHAWALFAAYGLFFGATEGAEKAFVADLAPSGRRGAAYGWYNLTIGLGALPASLVFGLVWDAWGADAAFGMGAAFAMLAALGLTAFVAKRPSAAAA
jgi:MFS family permease